MAPVALVDRADRLRRDEPAAAQEARSARRARPGTSGVVPYIGASTRPITRPRTSATRNPLTLRRSNATLLIGT